jgi:hypothetical protein
MLIQFRLTEVIQIKPPKIIYPHIYIMHTSLAFTSSSMTADDDLLERTTAGCRSCYVGFSLSSSEQEEDKNEATRPTSTQTQIKQHQLRRYIGDSHRCTKV